MLEIWERRWRGKANLKEVCIDHGDVNRERAEQGADVLEAAKEEVKEENVRENAQEENVVGEGGEKGADVLKNA